MNEAVEIGIAAALQLGALVWFLSSVKSDIRNMTRWLQSVDQKADRAASLSAQLKGHIENLPCARCETF